MYDFYKNPPQTREAIRDYLTSWLEPTSPQVPPMEIAGEFFIQELGFRRAFYIHSVMRNTITHEYVWWVFPDDAPTDFPLRRFPTYDALLETVVEEYAVLWGVSST